MTASELFSGRISDGPHRCYYCGARCGSEYLTAEYVKDTFTNRDIVVCPGSGYCCIGCVESIGLGTDEMMMIDRSTRTRTNARGMAPRMYSWVLTEREKLAATKAHISLLRDTVLLPPDPPFAIILSDSGQKQLIFRGVVSHDRTHYPLMLEDQRIDVDVDILRLRLTMAARLIAAIGKPALSKQFAFRHAVAVYDYYGTDDPLVEWEKIQHEPMSVLAHWLSPGKEGCQSEHPAIERSTVSAETIGVCGSGTTDVGGDSGGRAGDGGSLCFDFGEFVQR